MKNNTKEYSVLMPVYKGDKAKFLKIAIDSMLGQTIMPNEILIAVDGFISKRLKATIDDYKLKYPSLFTVRYYETNEGLGKLLNKALPSCRNEYIARMDADDYSLPERIEKQFEVLDKGNKIDVVGSNVDEFCGDITNIIAQVVLPEKTVDINKFAKRRCPIRHPSLLYKKSDVIRIGNYSTQEYIQNYVQDYDLVVKMIQNGLKIYNVQQPLVRMRTSKDFYKRRGGFYYLKCIFIAKRKFLNRGFMSRRDFMISFLGHAIVILMPAGMRDFVYRKFLRR